MSFNPRLGEVSARTGWRRYSCGNQQQGLQGSAERKWHRHVLEPSPGFEEVGFAGGNHRHQDRGSMTSHFLAREQPVLVAGRIARSEALLSIDRSPSSRYWFSAFHSLSTYMAALPDWLFGRNNSASSRFFRSSSSGPATCSRAKRRVGADRSGVSLSSW
jgi:hypothetical protein